MKKLIIVALLMITHLFAERVIIDQMGREVKLPDEVNRVVVLQHQTLNVINQLNSANKVVGVLESWEKRLGKEYIRLMPNLKDMPTPGDLKELNAESVLSLKPDVVFTTNYIDKSYIDQLEKLKIPVFIVSFL